MATRMQQRRGTAAQWISTNSGNGPILSPGEIGFESDTNKFKIGDGVNHWVDLTYFTDADSILAAVSGIVDGAPDLLNTLNELAAALGDDPNFLNSYATTSYVDTAIENIDALPAQSTHTGKFLTTDGSTASWATVDLSSKQDVVSGVSSTEIGYLDGVTSAIQTQLDSKLESSDLAGYATETYVDTAISNAEVDLSTAAGTNLDWNAGTSQFDVDAATLLTNPTISTGITLDGTGDFTISSDSSIVLDATVIDISAGSGDFTISADSNIILDATTEVYIGSAASGNEVATKSYADAAAAAIVDSAPSTLNTLNELAAAINDDASYAATITTALGNKQDKVSGVSDTEIGYLDGVTSAIQTQLDAKSPSANPTFTGTVDFTGATVTGISSYLAPTLGTTQIASGATVDKITDIDLKSSNVAFDQTLNKVFSIDSSIGFTTNGVSWSSPDSTYSDSINQNIRGAVYGNGKIVILNVSPRLAGYSTDAITWSFSTSGIPVSPAFPDYSMKNLTYGDGKYVSIGYSSQTAFYSTDAITWTTSTLVSSAGYKGAAYGAGKFVSYGYWDTKATYSTDAITWTQITVPADSGGDGVYFINNRFVTGLYPNKLAYSTDGVSWTAGTMPYSANWPAFAYGNGRYVAISSYSSGAASSTDLITWTTAALPTSGDWANLVYNDSVFVATRKNNNNTAYSTDGITWTAAVKSFYNAGASKLVVFPETAEVTSPIASETYVSSTLSSGGYVTTAGSQTLTNKVLSSTVLVSPEERMTVSATAATGTINFDADTQGALYYTSNASDNWTLNVRGNSGATLNSILATGDAITVAFLVTNGSTAYRHTALTIDGSAQTVRWSGGTAPSTGNASAIDAYSFTIIKTASATFTVLGAGPVKYA